MSSNYQPNIPTGTVALSQDYLNIQGDFMQLNTTIGTDHVAPAVSQNNGYHTTLHLVPNSTTSSNPPNNYPIVAPTITPGFGQLFAPQINDGNNIDEALYYQSGGGNIIQLTRNFQPTVDNSTGIGYTFLPGGFIIQWGNILPPFGNKSDGTQNYPLQFPNKVFNISMTAEANQSSNVNFTFFFSSATKTGFHWRLNNPSGNQTLGINWIAIGN